MIMKKNLLCLVCVAMLTTNTFAQIDVSGLKGGSSSKPSSDASLKKANAELGKVKIENDSLLAKLNTQQIELEGCIAVREKLQTENSDIKDQIKQMQSKYPVIITNVEWGNDFGEKTIEYDRPLRSSTLKFLAPKVHYTSMLDGNQPLLFKFIIIYEPKFLIKDRRKSKKYSEKITIEPGSNSIALPRLGEWFKSYYTAGRYTAEIWYDNVCLWQKDFEIE